MSPPPFAFAIEAAIDAARQSPCAKSKRGVAVFRLTRGPRAIPGVIAVGWNGLPGGEPCVGDGFADGPDAPIPVTAIAAKHCRTTCGQRCVHAEVRAIRHATRLVAPAEWPHLEAVHVKLGPAGKLVAGGGPSCWQCSREVLDVGLGRFWLYEEGDQSSIMADAIPSPPLWRSYTAAEFHRVTLAACKLDRL